MSSIFGTGPAHSFGTSHAATGRSTEGSPMNADSHPNDAAHDAMLDRFVTDDICSMENPYYELEPDPAPVLFRNIGDDLSKVDLQRFPFLFKECNGNNIVQCNMLDDFAREQWDIHQQMDYCRLKPAAFAIRLARIGILQMAADSMQKERKHAKELSRAKFAAKTARDVARYWREQAKTSRDETKYWREQAMALKRSAGKH